jgi:hypothetical protein
VQISDSHKINVTFEIKQNAMRSLQTSYHYCAVSDRNLRTGGRRPHDSRAKFVNFAQHSVFIFLEFYPKCRLYILLLHSFIDRKCPINHHSVSGISIFLFLHHRQLHRTFPCIIRHPIAIFAIICQFSYHKSLHIILKLMRIQ